MRFIKFLLVTVLIFILISCGANKNKSKKISDNRSKTSKSNISKIYKIKEVKFLKKPVEGYPIEVEVEFENEPEGKYNLIYEWYINNKLVEEVNSEILEPDFFTKDQWVFCRVKAVGKDFETSFVKSKYYKVLPATPSIIKKVVPKFEIPGTLTYQVEVDFPGIEREDWEEELSFEIISPNDPDLTISPTGLIEWELTKEKIKEFGKNISIEFKVSSLDGREVRGKLNINIK